MIKSPPNHCRSGCSSSWMGLRPSPDGTALTARFFPCRRIFMAALWTTANRGEADCFGSLGFPSPLSFCFTSSVLLSLGLFRRLHHGPFGLGCGTDTVSERAPQQHNQSVLVGERILGRGRRMM